MNSMSSSILQTAALQSALLESPNFPSIATDPQGVIQIFSKGAERMLGYTSTEVVNKIHLADLAEKKSLSTRATALNLTWTGGVQDSFAVMVSHAAKGQEDVYGLTYIRNDGVRLVVQVTAMALRDESKSIIGYLFVNTELKPNSIDAMWRANLDAMWQESEARYSTLCDMGVMGIYSCDKSGVIQKFNSRAAGLWGREPVLGELGELYCGSFKMMQMDNTPMPHDQGPMADIVSGRVTEVRDHEILIERPDGTRIAVMVNIRRIQNEHGEMTGAINCFNDITQRRKTDAQLRHNEDTFVNLIEKSPFGVCVIDAQFRIYQLSSGTKKLFSSTDSLIGQDYAQFLRSLWPEPFASDAIAWHRHTLETGEPSAVLNFTQQRQDNGQFETYEWMLERIVLPDGQWGVVCYFYNHTEREKAGFALRESEERYRTLFNSIDEGYCIIDLQFDEHGKAVDWRYVEVNPSFEKHTGMSAVVGKRIRECIANHEEYWFEIYGRVAKTGEPIRFVNAAKAMDRWFDLYAFRIGGEGSTKVAVLFRDITEHKLAENALRESEQRYRNLFSSIDEGYCIIEMIFDEHEVPIDYLFLEVNPSFERQAGIVNVTGKRVRELIPDLEHHWLEALGKVALTGQSVRFENEAKALGKWFDVYACRVNDPHKRKVAVVFNDISDRKRNELNLKNAIAVAESASRAKSDFLSKMSHELRTPLNAILGFAQLLERGSPLPTGTQTIRVHEILKAGWYLLDLINEILDLAVIESGKVVLARESVPLMEVLLECQSTVEPQARTRDIQISLVPSTLPYFVSADRTRVKQIVLNLLSNAIKYNHPHGNVEIKCAARGNDRVRISVKDNGPGLPPDKLNQLFQPFNRLGQEMGTQVGTGIGLMVAKQLVELMGGTVGVESTVGMGCEFWIELMRDAHLPEVDHSLLAEAISPDQENVGTNLKSPHTLLYVEDNLANLMLVQQILEYHSQIRLLTANDGDYGIQLARTRLPDIILMDIHLPGMSGLEALKVLRADPVTSHIPIIALTANAMAGDIEGGLREGFFRYITKPIKVNEFMNALDDALTFVESHQQVVAG